MFAADFITAIANIAAAVGVAVVVWQLALTRRQLRAGFERDFIDKYERIIERVPLEMILGEHTDVESDGAAFRAFFDYFEVCEEELYYRRVGKVSTSTWSEWWEGVALHLRRPAFRQAWESIKDRVQVAGSGANATRIEQFSLLRAAVDAVDRGEFHDPRPRPWWRLS